MMILIRPFARFVKEVRSKLRQGELSRQPVKLLRLEWKPERVECDWLMRPPDPWDAYIPPDKASENVTSQALKDALTLRNMIFKVFPEVDMAELRMFQFDAEQQLELMMTGTIARNDQFYERVPSMAMRAKLCGFHFTLAHGAFERRP
jgi:hypothetical protein